MRSITKLYCRTSNLKLFGRVYYWLPGCGSSVIPVHFGTALTHVEYREWFQEGAMHEAGGYDRPYKRIRTPMPIDAIPLEAAFEHVRRAEHRPWNERKIVPAMYILRDKSRPWWDSSKEEKTLNRYYPDTGEYDSHEINARRPRHRNNP